MTDRQNHGRDNWFSVTAINVMNSDGAGALNFEMTFEGEGGSTETERTFCYFQLFAYIGFKGADIWQRKNSQSRQQRSLARSIPI